jgi:hypothetical protein
MTTAAAGAGDAGTAGAAGAGTAGAAGAGTAGAASTATGTGTTAPATPWHGYTEPADVQYVANKGWKGPQDAIKSAREAEKFIGRDPSTLVALPRADDPQGFLAVMDKLGRPASPDKYEFDLPAGVDKNNPFLKWARESFHKNGVPANAAKGFMKEYNEFLGNQATSTQNEYKTSVAADKQTLAKEWGGGHERMMNVAKTAVAALGFTGEMIDALESQIGYAGVMKHFADLGQKMSEDTFVGAGSKPGSGKFGDTLTPAEAKQEWDNKKMDNNFMNALRDRSHPGHKQAQETQTKLFRIAYPNG